MSLTITSRLNQELPKLPFSAIKNKVLGKSYELSLVFVGQKRIRSLNRQYRKVDKSTDVLSFSLDKKIGEIFLCPEIIKKKKYDIDRTHRSKIGYLFIHGLLHLKGLRHSSKMDSAEALICSAFKI